MLTDDQLQQLFVVLALPLMVFFAVVVNIVVRVRNRRSFRIEARFFGVEVKMESTDSASVQKDVRDE